MRFALISDEHFGPNAFFEGKLRKLTAQAPELCRAFVERMNQEVKPDLVVNLGDVIEDESHARDLEHYGQFIEILSHLESPVLHVAGNHDQVNLSDDDLRRLWQHEGELHYGKDVAGVHFSVLRTIDGDTFEARVALWPDLTITTRVRLRGIDAPELKARCADELRRAQAAAEALDALLKDGDVVIFNIGPDKYSGRVDADVATRRTPNVSAAMLRGGYARAYDGGHRGSWCG